MKTQPTIKYYMDYVRELQNIDLKHNILHPTKPLTLIEWLKENHERISR